MSFYASDDVDMTSTNADSIFSDEYTPMGPGQNFSSTAAEVHTLREQIRQMNLDHGTEVFSLQSTIHALSSENRKLQSDIDKLEHDCKKLRNEADERRQEAGLPGTSKLPLTNSDCALLTCSSVS